MPDSSLKPTPTSPVLDYAPRRRMPDWFPSGTQFSNFLKTLVWVVPLTLLIWVYAEREETVKVTLPAFPIVVRTTAPDRVVELRYPSDQNVVVELSGPRARIDEVREKLIGKPLELVVDPQLGLGGKQLMAVNQLNNHPLFRTNGITVKACLPQTFSVDIDQIEEREAIIKAATENTQAVEFASFQPDRVKVRGPSRLLDAAPKEGKDLLVVYADFAGRSELNSRTGKVELDNVPLSRPRGDNITLSFPSVHATLTLKQPDAQETIGSVTVFKVTPMGFTKKVKYDMVDNVTVIGPPDLIKMIHSNPTKVTARLLIKDEPGATEGIGDLVFDLPPGVRVAKGTPEKWKYEITD